MSCTVMLVFETMLATSSSQVTCSSLSFFCFAVTTRGKEHIKDFRNHRHIHESLDLFSRVLLTESKDKKLHHSMEESGTSGVDGEKKSSGSPVTETFPEDLVLFLEGVRPPGPE